MKAFWNSLKKTPGGGRGRGLGRWFQILEESFMTLFWGNLLCLLFCLPFFVCLFFFLQTGDWLSGLGLFLSLGLLGPGVTGLNFVCMQLIRDKHVSLGADFLASVKRDWKQSAAFAWIAGALWGSLAWTVRLVSLTQGGLGIGLSAVLLVCAFVMTGLTVIGFQQIAMVRLPFRGVVRNGFLLMIAGGGRAAAAVAFSLAAAAVCLDFYQYCVWYLVLGAPALIVLTANLIFYPVFTRFFPEAEA